MMRKDRAFILLDFVLGITLVLILAGVFAHALWQTNRGIRTEQSLRHCLRAEQTILQNYLAGAPPTPPPRFSASKLSTPAPAGYQWVVIRRHLGHGEVTLSGLVPLSAKLSQRRKVR